MSISVTAASCFAQSFATTQKIADSLFVAGDYRAAETLYSRLLFFSDSSNTKSTAEQLAGARVAISDFTGAAQALTVAINLEKNDSLYNELCLQKALCLCNANNPQEALTLLKEIAEFAAPGYFTNKIDAYEGMIHAYAGQFYEAERTFLKVSASLSRTDSLELMTIFKSQKSALKKDPAYAKRLNFLLPGLGFMYIHETKYALGSFLINGSLATLFVYTGLEYTFLDAALFWGGLMPRYYLGGADLAGKTAEKNRANLNCQKFEAYYRLFMRSSFSAKI